MSLARLAVASTALTTRGPDMADAVICEPVRTPVGRYGGALRDVPAAELGATVVRALLRRTGPAPEHVDEVVLGHSYPTMDAPAIGRVVTLHAGLGTGVSGLQAAMAVRTGANEPVLAGGVESLSGAALHHRAALGACTVTGSGSRTPSAAVASRRAGGTSRCRAA